MFEKLTSFLEPLKKGAFTGTYVSPFRVNYSQTADDLMDAVYEFTETYTQARLTGYNEILAKAGIPLDDFYESDISDAEAETVLALLIAAVRREKLCTGAWLEAYESGAIMKWLHRLEELDG